MITFISTKILLLVLLLIKKDLVENLKSETRGNFETLLKALMRTPAQLEAHDLKKAIEVICS